MSLFHEISNSLRTIRVPSQQHTPKKCLVAGAMLAKTEAEAVMASASKAHLNDVETEQYIAAVAQTLSSPDIDDVIKKSAKEAQNNAEKVIVAFAATNIRMMALGIKKATVMREIVQAYASILLDSISLANNIAQYGDKFDTEVIPRYANERIPIDQRKARIAEYITQLEPLSNGMLDRLDKLNTAYIELLAETHDFAPAQDSSVQAAETESEHEDLIARIGPDMNIKKLLISLAFTLLHDLAAFLTIGGLIGVGRDHALNASLAISSAVAQSSHRQSEGFAYASSGSGSNNDATDARQIEDWLQEGAGDAEQPEYMKISLEKGIKNYWTMSKYLRGYAQGIRNMYPERYL
ncbi:hypothetical protein ETB97_005891 [Aspergillus alliaceus]|uniref:Uncharacterized protein n=1 Tax=Petromyces alliaceus TaxID=209559 RepID=A0A8H6E2X3_PETAA|nr:hypothetical protein ETB97_005891 [Aspergillus burnettii]